MNRDSIGWEGYGFSFKRPYKKNGEPNKWFAILCTLCLMPRTKSELFNEICPTEYNNPQLLGRRGWNSYIFSALRKEGYIIYSNKTKKWDVTNVGRKKVLNIFDIDKLLKNL